MVKLVQSELAERCQAGEGRHRKRVHFSNDVPDGKVFPGGPEELLLIVAPSPYIG